MNTAVSTSTSTLRPSHLPNHPNFPSKSQFPSLLNSNNIPNYAHLSLSSPYRMLRPISCSSSPNPPGEGDSRTVLDAFFLGKALGEALTERVESVVGEILSTVGRLQAEQQKQILDFQEDVLERAKRAKESAAREALEAQGRLVQSSVGGNAKVTNVASSVPDRISSVSPAAVVDPNGLASTVDEDLSDQDSISSIPIDD